MVPQCNLLLCPCAYDLEQYDHLNNSCQLDYGFSTSTAFEACRQLDWSYSFSKRERENCFHLSGPGCSKLTTSLVNKTLKFQTLISPISQYFLLKKCEKLLQCKSFSLFFNKKYQHILL